MISFNSLLKTPLQLFIFIFPFICFTQNNKKSFEGIITYKIEVSILKSTEYDEYYKQKYGDTLVTYISKKGDYKRVYKNSGEMGFDFVIYSKNTNELYAKWKNIDTVYHYNASQNNLTNLSIKNADTTTIIGYQCQSIIMIGIDTIGNQQVKTKYYYSYEPYLDPSLYENYNAFYYNKIVEVIKSQYLKMIMDLEDILVTFEVIEIKPTELKNDVFFIPKKIPKKKFKI